AAAAPDRSPSPLAGGGQRRCPGRGGPLLRGHRGGVDRDLPGDRGRRGHHRQALQRGRDRAVGAGPGGTDGPAAGALAFPRALAGADLAAGADRGLGTAGGGHLRGAELAQAALVRYSAGLVANQTAWSADGIWFLDWTMW